MRGTTRLHAAKNAVLPILAASIMTEGGVKLTDCPKLEDIRNMRLILEALGCETVENGRDIYINSASADVWAVPPELSVRLRSSIFMMGPLIARFRRANVAYPGGCDIGQRPIDLHLKGLRALGVKICERGGQIELDGENLTGGEVLLDFPSVGATENIMMAAALADGRSIILNAAREPEIVDLARFINKAGGKVQGAGEGRIVIDGVKRLNGCEYSPVKDRIVAGTLLVAAAITGGSVIVENANMHDMFAVTEKLRECGCDIAETKSGLELEVNKRLKSVRVATQPYPGFPTDMQAQFMALMCVCEGAGVIVENVFENRFAHAMELKRMGADITVYGRTAVIGSKMPVGAKVSACDLRAGAALTLAGLAADGITEVRDIHYIDRGYEALETQLMALGADIVRTKATLEER